MELDFVCMMTTGLATAIEPAESENRLDSAINAARADGPGRIAEEKFFYFTRRSKDVITFVDAGGGNDLGDVGISLSDEPDSFPCGSAHVCAADSARSVWAAGETLVS